jgi:hypothetical protein
MRMSGAILADEAQKVNNEPVLGVKKYRLRRYNIAL